MVSNGLAGQIGVGDSKSHKGPRETFGIFGHVHYIDCGDSFTGQYFTNFTL